MDQDVVRCNRISLGCFITIVSILAMISIAAGQLDLSGKWKQDTPPVGSSDWDIKWNQVGNIWEAIESGLGNAIGRASLSGNTFRIDWEANDGDWQGYYVWTLDQAGTSGTGYLVYTRKSGKQVHEVIPSSTVVRTQGPTSGETGAIIIVETPGGYSDPGQPSGGYKSPISEGLTLGYNRPFAGDTPPLTNPNPEATMEDILKEIDTLSKDLMEKQNLYESHVISYNEYYDYLLNAAGISKTIREKLDAYDRLRNSNANHAKDPMSATGPEG
jgi:hypothetical protein